MNPAVKKPRGRSLKDFLPLLPAEKELKRCIRLGEPAIIGQTPPQERTQNNCIRAEYLRFLALEGDEHAPVHEKGIEVNGAWVSGTLDLEGCDIPSNFAVTASRFEQVPIFRDAHIHGLLVLSGSQLPGLSGDRLNADGSLFLRNGFVATGEIRLHGARIGGALSCKGGSFSDAQGNALSADRANIQGSVFLSDDFKAKGNVRLLGAQIGGSLSCQGGLFTNEQGDALSADGANIQGDVFLSDDFKASGKVRLLGAQISGDLLCQGGKFESGSSGNAIVAERMRVEGSFQFRKLKTPVNGINLSSSRVGQLADDEASWGQSLILDGFTYGNFAGGAPCDASKRLAWLAKQRDGHYQTPKHFRPQPWKQLTRTLRRMGHDEDARQVAIAYETHRRKFGLIPGPARRTLHWLFGLFIGYGYRPLRLFCIMLGVWLFCAAIYWAAALHDVFAPSNPLVFHHPDYQHCRPDYPFPGKANEKPKFGNWYLCPELAGEYTGFSPLAYSLDLILPLVDLQQEHDWAPYIPTPQANWFEELTAHSKYHATRLLIWLEILFGWVASLLLVAVVSGLTNHDKDE